MNLEDLYHLGTSVWVDDLSRAKLVSGGADSLPARIAQGARGVTTNPAIFNSAISGSSDYADDMKSLRDLSHDQVIERLTTDDVRRACDLFADMARESIDGRVSIEVDPRFAHETTQTIEQARHLWQVIDRPNLMIKVPATRAGLPAITQLISEGISINVTLIFSVQRYQEVMDAYLSGLERRDGDLSGITSVASFFISRIDSAIDPLLAAAGGEELRGKVAIANARMAYQQYESLVASQRWKSLAQRGAHMQRPLWASTGVKDPQYSPTLYVDSIIAPQTVNTMPQSTIDATLKGGSPAGYPFDYAAEQKILDSLEEYGISLDQITHDLEVDGVKKFSDAWLSLIESVAKARS